MMIVRGTATLILGWLLATPCARSEVLYTDRPTFEAAASVALATETFDADIANAPTIVFSQGIASSGFNGLGNPINQVAASAWAGKVRTAAGVDGFLSITWTFPRPSRAFGVGWNSISSSRGVTLSGDWDGGGQESILLWTALGSSSGGFLGVIGSVPFSSVTLTAQGTGDNDVFGADNVAIQADASIFSDGFESGGAGEWSSTFP